MALAVVYLITDYQSINTREKLEIEVTPLIFVRQNNNKSWKKRAQEQTREPLRTNKKLTTTKNC